MKTVKLRKYKLNEEDTSKKDLDFETFAYIQELLIIQSISDNIRAKLHDYAYGGPTYDGGYYKPRIDNNLRNDIAKVIDSAVRVYNNSSLKLDDYDWRVVKKVREQLSDDLFD